MFMTDIVSECALAVGHRCHLPELKEMALNSIRTAFAADDVKARLLQGLEQRFVQFEQSPAFAALPPGGTLERFPPKPIASSWSSLDRDNAFLIGAQRRAHFVTTENAEMATKRKRPVGSTWSQVLQWCCGERALAIHVQWHLYSFSYVCYGGNSLGP